MDGEKLKKWLDFVGDLPDLPYGMLALSFLPWALPPTRHSGEPLGGPWSCPAGYAWATWIVEKAQVYREDSENHLVLQEEPRALSIWWSPKKPPSIVCWDPTKKVDSLLDRFDSVRIPSWEADQLYGWLIGHNDNLPQREPEDGNAIRNQEERNAAAEEEGEGKEEDERQAQEG